MGCYMWVPLSNLYDSANCLRLIRIRDEPSRRVLTAIGFPMKKMTIGLCIDYCKYKNNIYAGVEDGNFCCE